MRNGSTLSAFFCTGKRDEAEVARPLADFVVDLVGAAVLDVDVDAGELAQEFFQVGRQLVQADAVDGAQPDGAGDDVAHLGELVLERVELENDLLADLVKHLTLAGEAKALVATLDQRDAEAVLHGADLLADGGLGDEVQGGRLAEAAGLHEIAEDLERFDLHGLIYKDN